MKLRLFLTCTLPVLLVFSSVISQANYQGKPVQVKYKCSRGNDDVVEYSADGKTATIKNPGSGADWVLKAQPVESGFYFEDDGGIAIRGNTYDSIEIRTGSGRTFKKCVAVK